MMSFRPDWSRVDTVLLDMDGTVLDLAFDTLFWGQIVPQRYAELHDIALTEAVEKLTPLFRSREGTLEWYSTDFWSEQLSLDIKGLKRSAREHIGFLPGVCDFLERLAKTGRRIVLVTNAHGDSLEIKLEKTRLDRYFNAMFTSHEFGAPKEKNEFWLRLAQREGFDTQSELCSWTTASGYCGPRGNLESINCWRLASRFRMAMCCRSKSSHRFARWRSYRFRPASERTRFVATRLPPERPGSR